MTKPRFINTMKWLKDIPSFNGFTGYLVMSFSLSSAHCATLLSGIQFSSHSAVQPFFSQFICVWLLQVCTQHKLLCYLKKIPQDVSRLTHTDNRTIAIILGSLLLCILSEPEHIILDSRQFSSTPEPSSRKGHPELRKPLN